MRIVFAGTTPNAVEVLRYLVEQSGHQIVAVLTRLDAPNGRKQIMTPSAVAEFASKMGLRVIKANSVDASVDDELATLDCDLGVVVAYGALLKPRTLEIPRHGWINVHFSLLPKHRGAAPVQRSLIAGDTETGVTIFQLDQGLDTGDIHEQVATRIEPDENSGDLLARLTFLSITMLDECLAKISAEIARPRAQTGQATNAAKLSRSDCRIDFANGASDIEGLIRGCNPEPMAWVVLQGEPLRVLRGRASDVARPDGSLPGQVLKIENRIFVFAKDATSLELLEVQPASKRPMLASDWYRGLSAEVTLS